MRLTARLPEALARVLQEAPPGHDVRVAPGESHPDEPEAFWLWVDGSGSGMQFNDAGPDSWVGCNGTVFDVPAGQELSVLVVLLADTLQEMLIEDGFYATGQAVVWPQCPRHPEGQPLQAAIGRDGSAWWLCPKDRTEVRRIGVAAAP